MARIKTDEERGPVGAWAYHAREDAELSDEQVVELLARKGHLVHAATIRGVEGGTKKPGRKLLRLLGEVYHSKPPGQTEPAAPAVETADMVAALERQSKAIEALVDELRAARLDRVRLEALERAVERLLTAPAAAKSPRRPAPHGSTG